MIRLFPLFACLLSLVPLQAAGLSDDRAFLAEIKSACEAGDRKRLNALIYSEGLSADELARAAKIWDYLPAGEKIENLSLNANPKPYRSFVILRGHRCEATAPSAGLVQLDFAPAEKTASTLSLPYTVVNGAYWLVATKSSDLKWNGPEDQDLSFSLIGTGTEKIKVLVKYNVSGLDLEENSESAAGRFKGQHFSEIVVQCENPSADFVLSVLENGREIHRSESHKGVGELKYQRPPAP